MTGTCRTEHRSDRGMGVNREIKAEDPDSKDRDLVSSVCINAVQYSATGYTDVSIPNLLGK